MTENKRILVLDAGNTSLKLGLFSDGILVRCMRVRYSDQSTLDDLLSLYSDTQMVISSVLGHEQTIEFINRFERSFVIDNRTPLPILLNYNTPETLGIDRICNAVAIASAASGRNAVSIDIGTCIKFDFVDHAKVYQGGSISPGIHLRYKSLNDYTANLPLLDLTTQTELTGKSTNESIHSGVMNGMMCEIDHMIRRYQECYDDLTFFVTGGDAPFFDLEGKNNIFADENLTLKGLYLIYTFNAQ